MGKITDALKKVTNERIERIKKKPEYQYVIKQVSNSSIDQHVVSFHDSTSPVGEEYKILRTNIQSLKYSKNYKSFIITSAIAGEGKTLTSVNLAICMAHELNSQSVLLIDADLRKGRIERTLGIPSHAGLSEVLQGKAEPQDVFINPGIENLSVVSSGKTPKNPSELLNSKRMEQVLQFFKSKFDYIFIDSPPVMPLTDACILGPMADGVLLVIQAGKTQRDLVKHTESRMTQARAKVLGYILTNLEYHLPAYLYKKYAQGYGPKYYKADINASLED